MSLFKQTYFSIQEALKRQSHLHVYKDGTPIKHGDIVRYLKDKNKKMLYTVVGGDIYKEKLQLERNDGKNQTSPSWIHVKISQVEKVS